MLEITCLLNSSSGVLVMASANSLLMEGKPYVLGFFLQGDKLKKP